MGVLFETQRSYKKVIETLPFWFKCAPVHLKGKHSFFFPHPLHSGGLKAAIRREVDLIAAAQATSSGEAYVYDGCVLLLLQHCVSAESVSPRYSPGTAQQSAAYGGDAIRRL